MADKFDGHSLAALFRVLGDHARRAQAEVTAAGHERHATTKNGDGVTNSDLLALLRMNACVAAVYVWGSRVLGTSSPESDWDYQIVFAGPQWEGKGPLPLREALLWDSDRDSAARETSDSASFSAVDSVVQDFHDRVNPLAPLRGNGHVDDIGKSYFVFESDDHVVNVSFIPLDDWIMLARLHRYFCLDCLWLAPKYKLLEMAWLRAPMPRLHGRPDEADDNGASGRGPPAAEHDCDAVRTLRHLLLPPNAGLEENDEVGTGEGTDLSASPCGCPCGRMFSIFDFDVDLLRRTNNWESKMRWYSSRAMFEDKSPRQGVKYMFHALRYKIHARAVVENGGYLPDPTVSSALWGEMRGAEQHVDTWPELAKRFEGRFEQVKQELRDACGTFEVLYGWHETRRRMRERALPSEADLEVLTEGCCVAYQGHGRSAALDLLNSGSMLPACVEVIRSTHDDTFLLMHKPTCNCVRTHAGDRSREQRAATECAGTGLELRRIPCACQNSASACRRDAFELCSWGIERIDSWSPADNLICCGQDRASSSFAPTRVFELLDAPHVVLRYHAVAHEWTVVGPWDVNGGFAMCWQVSSHTDTPNPLQLSDLLWTLLFGPGVSVEESKRRWNATAEEELTSGIATRSCSFTFALPYHRHRFVARPTCQDNAVLVAVRDCQTGIELDPVPTASRLNVMSATDHGEWIMSEFQRLGYPEEKLFEQLSGLCQRLNPLVSRGFVAVGSYGTIKPNRLKFENARWLSITEFTDYTSLGSLNWRPDLDPVVILDCIRRGRRHVLHRVSCVPVNSHAQCLLQEEEVASVLEEFDALVDAVQREWDTLHPLLQGGDVQEFARQVKLRWCRKILFALKSARQGRDAATFFAVCTKKEMVESFSPFPRVPFVPFVLGPADHPIVQKLQLGFFRTERSGEAEG
jgi:hypothetical protein